MIASNQIKEVLLALGKPVYHFRAPQNTAAGYIVYGEDSQDAPLYADGKLCAQVLQGTIDYYTRDGEDVMADVIQKALNDAGISFWLNSVQYEYETNLVHFEWVWEVGNDQV